MRLASLATFNHRLPRFRFIPQISSRVGVPRILIISTIWETSFESKDLKQEWQTDRLTWSILFSPGKSGCPRNSSANTHPYDLRLQCYHTGSTSLDLVKGLPNVYHCGVIRAAKDQFGRPIISRAYVCDVVFSLHQSASDLQSSPSLPTLHENLCASKVAEFDSMGGGVQQKILRLDVSVANAQGMYVCQGSCHLRVQ
eukprot:763751-Hanusia_phi.AAC.3